MPIGALKVNIKTVPFILIFASRYTHFTRNLENFFFISCPTKIRYIGIFYIKNHQISVCLDNFK